MAYLRPQTIAIVVLITGLLLFPGNPAPAAVAAPPTADVTANVHLRKGPGTQFGIRTGVTAGTRVRIVGEKNGWAHVELNMQGLDYSGWIIGRYLRQNPQPAAGDNSGDRKAQTDPSDPHSVTAPLTTADVTTNVHLRKGPGTQFDIWTGVTAGTRVRIVGKKNDWVHVKLNMQGQDYSGWIIGRYLRRTSPPVSKDNGSVRNLQATPPAAQPVATPSPPSEKPAAPPAAAPQATAASPTADTGAASPAPVTHLPPAPPAGNVAHSAPTASTASTASAAASPPPTQIPATAPTSAAPQTPTPAPAVIRIPVPKPVPGPTETTWPWAPAVAFVSAAIAVVALFLSWRALGIAGRYRDLAVEYEALKKRRTETLGRADDKRRHSRTYRFVEVDFSVTGRFYHGLIDNISASGAFIETSGTFAVDEAITLSYPAPTAEGNIKRQGVITRLMPNGIAIAFSDSREPV